MAVWVCLLLVPMITLFAMALNMGIMMDARTELQAAADATALAAARSLNGKASGLANARTVAAAYSQKHTAYGDAVTIDHLGSDVLFGTWDFKTRTFTAVDEATPRRITAVQITNGRDGTGGHNAALTLPFGAFVGRTTTTVGAYAIAVGGGASKVECSVPFGVAECKVIDQNNELRCKSGSQRFMFSNDKEDGMGFVNLEGTSNAPSANSSADFIRSGGICKTDGTGYEIGTYKVQNGNDLNKTILDAMLGEDGKGKGGGAVDCMLEKSYTFPILDLACPGGNPKFNGDDKIVGFMKATIREITDNKGVPQKCADLPKAPPAVLPAVTKASIVLDISCEAVGDSDDTAGGEFINSTGAKLRIVK